MFILLWLLPLAVALAAFDTSRLPPLETILIVVPANCLLAFAPVLTVPLLELALALTALSTIRLPQCAVVFVVPGANRLLAAACVVIVLVVGALFVLVNFVGT